MIAAASSAPSSAPSMATAAWARMRDDRRARVGLGVIAVLILAALLAPLIEGTNPIQINLRNALQAPSGAHWLGTDAQGRDVWSRLVHGARISLLVGLSSVALSVLLGVSLGLWAGFWGGKWDALIMRTCDVMLSFPAILVALLIAGVGRALFPQAHEALAFGVLIASITLTGWVQYARTVRGSTLVERHKEYVQAARVTGVSPARIMRRHVLPNVMGPVLVLATIQVATAIITEATLSFLGVGAPPTSPSLGTLIRVGNDYLFSGEWWITIFPGLMLVLISLSVNLLGDWLRDALNPRLQ